MVMKYVMERWSYKTLRPDFVSVNEGSECGCQAQTERVKRKMDVQL